MNLFVAMLLLGIAILLFVAVRKHLIDGATLQTIANVTTAVAFLAAIAVLVLPSAPHTGGVSTSPTKATALEPTSNQNPAISPSEQHAGRPTQTIIAATNTLTSPSTETPTPSQVAMNQANVDEPNWSTEYYDNRDFSGLPVATASDQAINFDWGEISPTLGVPVDFSVRWTRCLNFENRYYEFYTEASTNDRVWVYIDNTLINDGGNSHFLVSEGWHCLRVDFLDFGYYASIVFDFQPLEAAPSIDFETAWLAEYFDNRQLDGAPIFTRHDPAINFDWGEISPAIGVPVDFSVRWTRCLNFENRNYDFHTTVSTNDRVKVFIDDTLVNDGGDSIFLVPAGQHCFKVEFLDFGFGASIEFTFR